MVAKTPRLAPFRTLSNRHLLAPIKKIAPANSFLSSLPVTAEIHHVFELVHDKQSYATLGHNGAQCREARSKFIDGKPGWEFSRDCISSIIRCQALNA
ncbi:hypothetical protein [Bradyrhizobium sp. S3.2.12]|uniref:hypothetical protein n=1 Tax=Bradyrhizobium sp. S3.2.12 TaxID=3156387 RepID=UPI00339849A9